jgi:ABC-2 type transport system permease protein/oleandomycin transport system permease protein
MAAVTAPSLAPASTHRPALESAITDTIAMTWRNLRGMTRVPQVIVLSVVQPIIIVLTFRYVFGGAINVPGDYVDFLMPGIFVLTVAFGAVNTAVGLSEDLHTGLIERFRSLPIARSAVLAGRTLADMVRNLFVITTIVILGFLVGFDIHAGWGPFVASIGLLLLFGFALSWVFALIGLLVPNAESAQAAAFPVLAVLVFASTAFVPLETMPGWLQAYNKVQPVSVTVDAVRALALGGPTSGDVLKAMLCAVAIVAVFAPLAVARYRRRTR